MTERISVGFQNVIGSNRSFGALKRETSGSSGFDLRAIEEVLISAGDRVLVKTGIKVQIPFGYEGQIRPRSGLALKKGITVLNAPGTIDSDYRGEIGVILINLGNSDFLVEHGRRIAQLIIQAVPDVTFVEFDELSETERNSSGFGSTGTK